MGLTSERDCPSLEEIRQGKNIWWHRSKSGGIVHSDKWDVSTNPEFTLRIEKCIIEYLVKHKFGPKSKYGKARGVGRRPSGRTYQIRREASQLLLNEHPEWWSLRLKDPWPKSVNREKLQVNIRMPNLSVAVGEFIQEIRKSSEITNHSIFKKSWQWQICRLIEIKVLNRYGPEIEKIIQRSDGINLNP